MRKINYKSDFDFILKLTDCKGEAVGWPEFDWSAQLYTKSKANAYTVSCRGGVCANCFNDEGRIHVVVDSHRLGLGRLNVELKAELPNGIYPDGTQDEFSPQALDIELVAAAGDCGTEAEVEAMLPYIKGEPFTYGDFTPEQIADLKRPATEAAERLDGFVKTASEAEAVRESNERTRVSAEQTRVTQETERDGAETTRQSNETKRVDAEALREQAESKREEAEALRTESFAGFENEIDEAKRQVFIDMWNTACGVYGKYDPANAPDPELPFYLNELWLTYEEAVDTMTYGNKISVEFAYNGTSHIYIRTNLPPLDAMPGQTIPMRMKFNSQAHLETALITVSDKLSLGADSYAFFGNCRSLHTILGGIDVYNCIDTTQTNSAIFPGCVSLRTVKIYNLRKNFSLKDCKSISIESLSFMIVEAANTTVITVIVHPDVYAKLTGDTTNASAAALTPEELAQWRQVLTDAAEKNITFATA